MMKIKWGIPICLLMILLILGFFARADIQHHFMETDTVLEEKTIFTASQLDIFFNENKVLSGVPLPEYHLMEIIPNEKNWQSTTIAPLVDFLKAHNEKALKITGHFLENEAELQLGGYKNIGEARAGALKQELIAAGIAAPRILIDYQQIKAEIQKPPFAIECLNDSTIIP